VEHFYISLVIVAASVF